MNYLPEAKNDNIFTFVGDKYALICGIIFAVLITLIIFIIRKKRKGEKK